MVEEHKELNINRLSDFFNNPVLSDITIINALTHANYKYICFIISELITL